MTAIDGFLLAAIALDVVWRGQIFRMMETYTMLQCLFEIYALLAVLKDLSYTNLIGIEFASRRAIEVQRYCV